MKKINELTELREGDIIYAPELDKYFYIVEYGYDMNFKDMHANLVPTNKNPKEKGFTITLKSIISLGYYKC
jgi:hypothetical protein